MYVENVEAVSLGITEKEAGEYQGKPYPGYCALNFVVKGEPQSRRDFLNDAAVKTQAYSQCVKWGSKFRFNGNVAPDGKIKVLEVLNTQ